MTLKEQNDKLYSKIRSASLNGDTTLRDILYELVSLNKKLIDRIENESSEINNQNLDNF